MLLSFVSHLSNTHGFTTFILHLWIFFLNPELLPLNSSERISVDLEKKEFSSYNIWKKTKTKTKTWKLGTLDTVEACRTEKKKGKKKEEFWCYFEILMILKVSW